MCVYLMDQTRPVMGVVRKPLAFLENPSTACGRILGKLLFRLG